MSHFKVRTCNVHGNTAHRKVKSGDGYTSWICKACQAESNRKARHEAKTRAIQYLGGACLHCGLEAEYNDVYDFHHVDPSTKKYPLGSIWLYPWKTVQEELDKCILLCANCHRVLHAKENECKRG